MHAAAAIGVFLCLSLVGITGCGSDGATTTGGAGGSPSTTSTTAGAGGGFGGAGGAAPTSAYDPAHVLEVALTLAPADWDKLRYEANDLQTITGGDCLAGPKPSAYNYYPAAVTLDGQAIAKIDVRKKGTLGSLSVSRPSLKLKLDAHDPKARFFEADKLTLNNLKQDSSLLRTCLALELFAASGVPSPRCSFAHVTVNGKDLGVYANVEGLDEAALGRLFTDGSGNLYEGVMSDFRPDWQDTYEKKTNTADPDRSDVEALTTALLAPDAELLAEVDPLVDLDAFLTFWASEAVLGSWDAYTNSQNNHFVYHDPKSAKLTFLPWSPDATFGDDDPFAAGGKPRSVYATSALPQRLYGLPEIRSKYRTRLLSLIEKMLVSGPAQAEIDRMEALLAPFVDAGDGAWKAEVEVVRQFVKDRPALLQAEVASGPVEYPFTLATSPCVVKRGTVSGSFATKMGTLEKNNPFGTGSGKVHLDLDSMPVDAGTVGSAISLSTSQATLTVVGVFAGGQIGIVVMLIDPSVFAPGADLPFDQQQVFGVYGTLDDQNDFHVEESFDNGTVHLDKAGPAKGDAVTGTFTTEAFGLQP
jgi:hypothetical protein